MAPETPNADPVLCFHQDPNEASSLMPLLNDVFGPREGAQESLKKWIQSPEHWVCSARFEEQIVAIAVARYEDNSPWVESLSWLGEPLLPFQSGRIGMFQILAVSDAWRPRRVNLRRIEAEK